MKRNIFFIIPAFSLLVATAAYGQEPGTQDRDVNRQVDVTRDYTPDVEKAAKLPMIPSMSDTVALRPEFDYTITPRSWVTGFGVAAINPVRLSTDVYNPVYPFYLKVGGGAPGQSIAEMQVSTTGTGGGYAGAYVYHYGQFGKIKNDYDIKARGWHTTNDIGIYGKTNIGRRLSLRGEIGFDYNAFSRYAHVTSTQNDSPILSYAVPRASVVIGNDFSDLSYFNFNVGAEGYLLSDRDDNKENGAKVFFGLGKQFGVSSFILKGSFDGAFGGDDRQGNILRIYQGGLDYFAETDRIRFGLGADVAHVSRSMGEKDTYFLPRIDFSFNPAEGAFIPFARIESTVEGNSLNNMRKWNPYVDPATVILPVTRKYDLRAGVMGSISSNFTYRVFVGGGIHKDAMFFYDDMMTYTGFGIITDEKVKLFTAGGELEGRISGSFTAGLSFGYYNYSLDVLEHASGMPAFDGGLNLRYNYREKFYLRVGAKLLGKRDYLEISYPLSPGLTTEILMDYKKLDASVDLSLEAEYFLNKGFGVFLLGRNLGNSKIYMFNHYPDKGINISAGIKLLF